MISSEHSFPIRTQRPGNNKKMIFDCSSQILLATFVLLYLLFYGCSVRPIGPTSHVKFNNRLVAFTTVCIDLVRVCYETTSTTTTTTTRRGAHSLEMTADPIRIEAFRATLVLDYWIIHRDLQDRVRASFLFKSSTVRWADAREREMWRNKSKNAMNSL